MPPMKMPALLLTLSVAANAALLAAFSFHPESAPPALRSLFAPAPTAAEVAARTRAAAVESEAIAAKEAARKAEQAVFTRAKLWSALQSDDLKTLVARLRTAGFSPKVVSAIATAEIDARNGPRLRALFTSMDEAPFWKPPQGSFGNSIFFVEMGKISRERTKLLREVLGDDFFGSRLETASIEKRRQFGNLPEGKINEVQRIADDYTEMSAQIRAATQGIVLPEDRDKLALLEEEKRTDLLTVLSPEELADYEMRTSRITMRLAPSLTLMDASEEEFHAIYRIQQPFADTLYPIAGGGDWAKRNEALQQAATQLKAALGERRYADYVRAGSMEFQMLNRLAQKEGISKEAAMRAFSFRDSVAAESNRIHEDSALTPDQRRAALQTLAQSTKANILSTLGTAAGTTYIQSARWLTGVEQGGAVSFGPDGNSINVSRRAPDRK